MKMYLKRSSLESYFLFPYKQTKKFFPYFSRVCSAYEPCVTQSHEHIWKQIENCNSLTNYNHKHQAISYFWSTLHKWFTAFITLNSLQFFHVGTSFRLIHVIVVKKLTSHDLPLHKTMLTIKPYECSSLCVLT